MAPVGYHAITWPVSSATTSGQVILAPIAPGSTAYYDRQQLMSPAMPIAVALASPSAALLSGASGVVHPVTSHPEPLLLPAQPLFPSQPSFPTQVQAQTNVTGKAAKLAPVVPAATNTLATTYVATYAAPSPRIASPNYPTQWVALPGAQPITGSTPGMSHQAFSLPERDVFTVDSQDALRQAYVQSAAPLVQSMAEKSDRYAELAEKHPVTALTTSTILFGLGVVAALSAARMALIGLMMNGVKRLCYEVPWIKAQITEPVARLFGNRVALWGLGLGLSSAVAFSIHEQLKQVASGASVLGSSSTPGSTGQIQPSTTSIETH